SKPIFSVDIHPKGGRFATGGQGGSGGRIVIWNIAPVLSEHDENDPKVPKMLCQMDNHLACVNVVRWSSEGHLLASGGDDKLVMIWRLTSEGSSSIFGSGKVNLETWKCVHTLNSHNGDVLDLAWAPHDGWLASGSVDNTVIIWNAHKFPEKVAVLKGHTGMVKGVTWDPVGKYIASQSDDKSLRIWRTCDWVQQEVVKDPFVDCSATTHVLRLSWSPDGQYLVSSHAMNGGGPTAQIIEREGWRQDKDFVGHRKAVTC
ncbi:HIRA-like, partial [Asbolus verrucosus]